MPIGLSVSNVVFLCSVTTGCQWIHIRLHSITIEKVKFTTD